MPAHALVLRLGHSTDPLLQVNEQQSPDAPTPEQVLLDSMTREWLRIHGAPLPVGKLTAQQAHEIRDCFDLLDEDGSGALTVDEFQRAFKMLGMKVWSWLLSWCWGCCDSLFPH